MDAFGRLTLLAVVGLVVLSLSRFRILEGWTRAPLDISSHPER